MHQDITPLDSPAIYPDDYDTSLNGVGGWLALVVFSRFLSVISGILIIVKYTPYFGLSRQSDVYLGFLLGFYVIVYILGSVAILYMMFSRRIGFRKLFVIQCTVSICLYLLLFILYGNIGAVSLASEFVQLLVFSAIWITYLYKSKRVRNTYIYPFKYPETHENI